MQLIRLFLISIFFFSTILFAKGDSNVYNIAGKDTDSIIVKDLTHNKTIYKKGDAKLLRPASLTKIMTCILAIESGKLNQVVTITRPMIQVEPTIIDLKVGDQVMLKDLVYAALIKSANDAAFSIAYFLGNNSKDQFVSLMNKKAKKLGMKNTNFQNPAGFDQPNHKTTAKDLTKLAEYAIKNKTFNSIVKMKSYSFKALNSDKKFAVYTSNKLQKENKYVVGLKTGYTSGAGACLIARAKKDNKDILLVMLNADNRWKNAKNIVNDVINSKNNNYSNTKLASKKVDKSKTTRIASKKVNKSKITKIASKKGNKSKMTKIASKKVNKAKAHKIAAKKSKDKTKHKIASNKSVKKSKVADKEKIVFETKPSDSNKQKIEALYANL